MEWDAVARERLWDEVGSLSDEQAGGVQYLFTHLASAMGITLDAAPGGGARVALSRLPDAMCGLLDTYIVTVGHEPLATARDLLRRYFQDAGAGSGARGGGGSRGGTPGRAGPRGELLAGGMARHSVASHMMHAHAHAHAHAHGTPHHDAPAVVHAMSSGELRTDGSGVAAARGLQLDTAWMSTASGAGLWEAAAAGMMQPGGVVPAAVGAPATSGAASAGTRFLRTISPGAEVVAAAAAAAAAAPPPPPLPAALQHGATGGKRGGHVSPLLARSDVSSGGTSTSSSAPRAGTVAAASTAAAGGGSGGGGGTLPSGANRGMMALHHGASPPPPMTPSLSGMQVSSGALPSASSLLPLPAPRLTTLPSDSTSGIGGSGGASGGSSSSGGGGGGSGGGGGGGGSGGGDRMDGDAFLLHSHRSASHAPALAKEMSSRSDFTVERSPSSRSSLSPPPAAGGTADRFKLDSRSSSLGDGGGGGGGHGGGGHGGGIASVFHPPHDLLHAFPSDDTAASVGGALALPHAPPRGSVLAVTAALPPVPTAAAGAPGAGSGSGTAAAAARDGMALISSVAVAESSRSTSRDHSPAAAAAVPALHIAREPQHFLTLAPVTATWACRGCQHTNSDADADCLVCALPRLPTGGGGGDATGAAAAAAAPSHHHPQQQYPQQQQQQQPSLLPTKQPPMNIFAPPFAMPGMLPPFVPLPPHSLYEPTGAPHSFSVPGGGYLTMPPPPQAPPVAVAAEAAALAGTKRRRSAAASQPGRARPKAADAATTAAAAPYGDIMYDALRGGGGGEYAALPATEVAAGEGGGGGGGGAPAGGRRAKHLECTECPKTFRSLSDFDAHMRTHTGEKPLVCSFPGCGKAFAHNSNLKAHERGHMGVRPYCCTFPGCGKSYRHPSSRDDHYDSAHRGIRKYVCPDAACAKTFTAMANLNRHRRAVHGHITNAGGAAAAAAAAAGGGAIDDDASGDGDGDGGDSDL